VTRRKRHWLLLASVVVVLISAAWWECCPRPSSAASALGPIGGPSIAQDVNTLVGQKAQPFSLPDAAGAMRQVVPGRGRTVLLVFHMGRY
jgi:hypothetical protein